MLKPLAKLKRVVTTPTPEEKFSTIRGRFWPLNRKENFCGSVTLILSFRLSKPYLVKAEGDEKDNAGHLLPVKTVVSIIPGGYNQAHISLKARKYIRTSLIKLRPNIKYIKPTTDSDKRSESVV